MKLGFWGWFGIVIGILGLGIAIAAIVNAMTMGNLFASIIIILVAVVLPVVIVIALLRPFVVRDMKNSQKEKRLQQVGRRTSAKILNVQDTGMTVNLSPYVNITVQMPNGNSATFQMFVSRVQIPRPGDVIEVLYDPSDPTVVMAA